MNLVFISSFMDILNVIDFIEHEEKDFRILSSDDGLLSFFSKSYDSNNIIKLPKLFRSFRNITKLSKDFIALSSHKKRILKECEKLDPTTIIFSYTNYEGFESWLIKKLAGSVQVYYRPRVDINLLKDNSSYKLSIKSFVLSCIYGIKFKPGIWYGYPTIAIDESFLKLVHAQKYNRTFNSQNIKRFMHNKFRQSNAIEVLLLTGGEYNLDQEEYKRIMNDVYGVLIKYYKPLKIGVKNHPNFPIVKFEWEDNCMRLDSKIPANLLCYKAKVVIAYGSSVLYEAADIGIRAISTAYIIPSTLNGQDDRTAQYLLDNSKSKKISFPHNIDEFNDLLIKWIEVDI